MEQEQESAGVARGQNQLHVLPEEWHALAAVLAPLFDRLEADTAAPQFLIVTSDAEAAAGVAGRVAPDVVARRLRVLAATDARRAARVQRATPAQIVVGSPSALLELIQSTALKLDAVRAVALAWVDEVDDNATRALETIMSELPKDAARIVVASAVSPAVEQLVERYARRARRMQSAVPEAVRTSLSYVAVNEAARSTALRRVLDAVDPESAFIVARRPESRTTVDDLLRSLGYGADSHGVRVGETADAPAELVVLFDLPGSSDDLRSMIGANPAARVVAIVTPRQIAALRRFAGGAISPFVLPEAAVRARSREQALREELRALLDTGQFSRELLALEPLLSEYDGAEVAAAALRLLELERVKQPAPVAASVQAPLTRLFLNVGSMDNVRPGDLVGAITNEAGISKAEVGRVDVRERHSTVDVATTVANSVVSKLTGVSIRGRRVIARVDDDRERRERPDRSRRDDVRLGTRGGGRDRGGPPRDSSGRPPRRDRDRPRRDDA